MARLRASTLILSTLSTLSTQYVGVDSVDNFLQCCAKARPGGSSSYHGISAVMGLTKE